MTNGSRTCFVVMGFSKKTDYATGRTLDLDKTYRTIIKPAAQAAGLQCVRADEIVHSGVIDVPMYRQLLTADVVIADVSTLNANALYELGVRHALRPYSTIVIGESQLRDRYPFDVNHTVIRYYVHSGDVIDYEETIRFRDALAEAIAGILRQPADDSPVYVYLKGLQRPTLEQAAAVAAIQASPAATPDTLPQSPYPLAPLPAGADASLGALLEQARAAMDQSQFAVARPLLEKAHELRPKEASIVQRLALATYKSKQPSAVEALMAGRAQLAKLDPEAANDPETLGLWGAVHKRLWDETRERAHLDTAVFGYEKGFYLRNDYYNGINLAFLLNVRASVGPPAEAVADFVAARRVRERVARIARGVLEEQARSRAGRPPRKEEIEQMYWITATVAEAQLGLDDVPAHEAALAEAFALPVAEWMRESTRQQLARLTALLADSPVAKFIRP